jgi:hypothetical protein
MKVKRQVIQDVPASPDICEAQSTQEEMGCHKSSIADSNVEQYPKYSSLPGIILPSALKQHSMHP